MFFFSTIFKKKPCNSETVLRLLGHSAGNLRYSRKTIPLHHVISLYKLNSYTKIECNLPIEYYMLLHPLEGSITFIAQDPCCAPRGRYQRREGDTSDKMAIPPVRHSGEQ